MTAVSACDKVVAAGSLNTTADEEQSNCSRAVPNGNGEAVEPPGGSRCDGIVRSEDRATEDEASVRGAAVVVERRRVASRFSLRVG